MAMSRELARAQLELGAPRRIHTLEKLPVKAAAAKQDAHLQTDRGTVPIVPACGPRDIRGER